jgi:glycosyltransferase involved in cell wall biosynthesis
VGYYSFSTDGHVAEEYPGQVFWSPYPAKNKNVSNVNHFKDTLKSFNPDIVINQMPYENEIVEAIWEVKLKGAKYKTLTCLRNTLMTFINNIDDVFKRRYGVWSNFMLPLKLYAKFKHKRKHARQLENVIEKSDRFILLAPTNARDLEFFLPNYKRERVTAIPNSIPLVHPEALEKKKKIILSVGNINVPHKRSDLLVPFWKQIKDRLPDWEMVVVGDGDYLDDLKTQVNSQKIERISIEGRQQPNAYYEKASFFVMFSAFEGFPNTIVEAQSYGCPVAAFNTFSSLEYVVNDGRDGFILKPFDVEALSDKVAATCLNPKSLQQMASSSIDNSYRFEISQVGAIWLNLFKEIGLDG